MGTHLTTEAVAALPRLSWLATVDRDTGDVHVLHGESVETGPDFAVEGVWDGPFAEASFHKAEHFFGSGIHLDGDRVWLVPSHAFLVDRVVYALHGRDLIASNSLALLLGYTGAELEPSCDYRKLSAAMCKGLSGYEPRYPVRHPEIDAFYQLSYEAAVVSPTAVEKVPARPPVPIAAFDEYLRLMTAALGRIHANYTSPDRRTPLRAFSTISSGYDSTAVTTLVRELGVEACFTLRRAWYNFLPLINPGIVIDDGTPAVRHLGLKPFYLRRRRDGISEDELFFHAPCTYGAQVIFHSMGKYIEENCRGAVVFVGIYGDRIWDTHASGDCLSDQIPRGDASGMDLSEIRLKAGFIHVAVPLMYARSLCDLVAISNSTPMKPWSLGNDYDRPIPRRIAEEAGIPRGAFGRKKKAVFESAPYPYHRGLRRSFFAHLSQRFGYSTAALNFRRWVDRINSFRRMAGLPPGRYIPCSRIDFPYELHLWALERLSRKLGSLLPARLNQEPRTETCRVD